MESRTPVHQQGAIFIALIRVLENWLLLSERRFKCLGESMDVEGAPGVYLNTPGYVCRDMIIIGANVAESVPGAVRAFDARAGKRKWIFHTLPRPGEFGSDTWRRALENEALRIGRGWQSTPSEASCHFHRNYGTGLYGGERYENLFANSVVAECGYGRAFGTSSWFITIFGISTCRNRRHVDGDA